MRSGSRLLAGLGSRDLSASNFAVGLEAERLRLIKLRLPHKID